MDTTQLTLFPDTAVTGPGTPRAWGEIAAEQAAELPAPSDLDIPLFAAEDVQS